MNPPLFWDTAPATAPKECCAAVAFCGATAPVTAKMPFYSTPRHSVCAAYKGACFLKETAGTAGRCDRKGLFTAPCFILLFFRWGVRPRFRGAKPVRAASALLAKRRDTVSARCRRGTDATRVLKTPHGRPQCGKRRKSALLHIHAHTGRLIGDLSAVKVIQENPPHVVIGVVILSVGVVGGGGDILEVKGCPAIQMAGGME